MSMPMALEYVGIWLRLKNTWTREQCDVQPDAIPPYNAGPWYVAIDDAGVEGGEDDSDYLKETLTITIGVWHRPEYLQMDRQKLLKAPNDLYIAGAKTLHKLERLVLIHKSAVVKKDGLHNNWEFLAALNSNYSLPSVDDGAAFIRPLRYKGRGRMEETGYADDKGNAQVWKGYRLRLRGLERIQKLRALTDAVG